VQEHVRSGRGAQVRGLQGEQNFNDAGKMDKNLLNAFKKIEKQVADSEAQLQKAELDKERARLREIELRRQKFRERLVLGVTFSFACLLMFFAWYSDGGVVKKAGNAIRAVGLPFTGANSGRESILISLDCSLSENFLTPYCVALRNSKTKANWSGISLNDEGKESPFSLHQKK